MDVPWLLIAFFLAAVVIGIVFWKIKNRKKVNYKALFYAGVMWIFLGFAMDSPAFWIIGIAMVVISLYHQKEWKNKKMAKKERMQMAKMLIAIAVAFIVAVAILLFLNTSSRQNVQAEPEMNFSLCSSAGGNWNDCSNSCAIDNQGKNYGCPQACEPLCECAGIAGFGCPEGYVCKTPSGIVDALGFCVKA